MHRNKQLTTPGTTDGDANAAGTANTANAAGTALDGLSRRGFMGSLGALGCLALAARLASGEPASPLAALSARASGSTSADASTATDTGALARELTMALSVDPDGLDPQRTASAVTQEITNNIYDPLLRVSTSGELVAGLAESWQTSEDGLTLTFMLREGLRFSNGESCDAQAVLDSFARLQSDGSPRRSQYADYSFAAKDSRTIEVTMPGLNVAALSDFAYNWSAIVYAAAGDDLKANPVGTGPYKLESWTPQDTLVLVTNDNYWGSAALTPRITLKTIPDSATQVSALRAGEVDWIMAESSQVAAFEGDSSFQIISDPKNSVQLMAMNSSRGQLGDLKIRQAINMAINKDEIIQTVWWGFGQKIASHYPPVLNGYVDCNDIYSYDPEKAKQLLEEAGHASDLSFTLRLPKNYSFYVDAGEMIADYLGRVGITCTVEIVEWASWLEEVYNGHQYDLTVVGHTGRIDPITMLARYHSDSSENYFEFSNADVDALIGQYQSGLDADTRLAICKELQRTLAENLPAVYIQAPVVSYIAKASLEGFVTYPVDIYELKDISLTA